MEVINIGTSQNMYCFPSKNLFYYCYQVWLDIQFIIYWEDCWHLCYWNLMTVTEWIVMIKVWFFFIFGTTDLLSYWVLPSCSRLTFHHFLAKQNHMKNLSYLLLFTLLPKPFLLPLHTRPSPFVLCILNMTIMTWLHKLHIILHFYLWCQLPLTSLSGLIVFFSGFSLQTCLTVHRLFPEDLCVATTYANMGQRNIVELDFPITKWVLSIFLNGKYALTS